MVFNILIGNTDDHEKNRALVRGADGFMRYHRLLMYCLPHKVWAINKCVLWQRATRPAWPMRCLRWQRLDFPK